MRSTASLQISQLQEGKWVQTLVTVLLKAAHNTDWLTYFICLFAVDCVWVRRQPRIHMEPADKRGGSETARTYRWDIWSSQLIAYRRVLLDKLMVPGLVEFPVFYEPKGSLTCSQEPATCSCPHYSNPDSAIPSCFLKIYLHNTVS